MSIHSYEGRRSAEGGPGRDIMIARLAHLFSNGRSEAVTETVQPAQTAPDEPAPRFTIWVVLYYSVVIVGAALCGSQFVPHASTDGWHGFATLIVLAIVLERYGMTIYGDTHVSGGVVALFAIAILYGAPGAALAAPIVVLAAEVRTDSPWHTRLFNMSCYTVANVVAALIFRGIIDVSGSVTIWWVVAALPAIAVNYGINASLVTTAFSLRSGQRWLPVWKEKYQWIVPYYVIFGLLGLALATAYLALGVAGILAFAAPPLMMRVAMHQYVSKTEQTVLELKQKNFELQTANQDILAMTRRLTETYDGTLEALVLALDARDHETKGHSFRVAAYAMAIARHMGLEENNQDWIDMQRGALLHDIGKIGVPDFILHKPGPLTPEEWTDMKRHPHIGHEMLKEISFLTGAAAIVHAHHERFDGKGYPLGLASDEIPIGARIFTIADAFDAMTSDRPYRKALTPEAAWQEVLRHSGTQFDPQVVQAFLSAFEEIIELSPIERDDETARAA
jgi:putative nucleotidyltransferase with HDIG domain